IGKRAPNSPPRCSSGSRRSTTLAAGTPGWAMSAPPTTKHFTTVSPLRHDHHTNRVHGTGSGSRTMESAHGIGRTVEKLRRDLHDSSQADTPDKQAHTYPNRDKNVERTFIHALGT